MGRSAFAERPGRLEVVAVVAGCLLVLFLLARLDDAAVREEARKVSAARQPAAQRAPERPGERAVSELLLLALAGTGLAMSAAGARILTVSRRSA